ncbi:hypothetical protein TNCV_1968601 [Trichonephila clavipes]|nr:hypothetical protein TNCV_1968601 [Trichonephila clavipes]
MRGVRYATDDERVIITSLYKETQRLIAMDLAILSVGQVTRRTLEMVPPLPASTPLLQKDFALDSINKH